MIYEYEEIFDIEWFDLASDPQLYFRTWDGSRIGFDCAALFSGKLS